MMESMPFRKPGSLREIGPVNFDSFESRPSFSGESLARTLRVGRRRQSGSLCGAFLNSPQDGL